MLEGNQTSTSGRGGFREGSGRPVGSKSRGAPLTRDELKIRLQRLVDNGALGNTSRAVLAAIGVEETWIRLMTRMEQEGENSQLSDALKFHQQMRDGRPAQQINVTSMSVRFSADEIARARAIVREMVPQTPLPDDTRPPTRADAPDDAVQVVESKRLMLRDGQGARIGRMITTP